LFAFAAVFVLIFTNTGRRSVTYRRKENAKNRCRIG
jgi:hypothetical protein